MARRELTMERYEEIKRLLKLGRTVREIARSLKCSRDTVRGVRDGKTASPDQPKPIVAPLWSQAVAWDQVVAELRLGHPLKFIWEDQAQSLTTYSNFWKQFYRRFPHLKDAAITLRFFEPGERCEVDYAGDRIDWLDIKTGEIRHASVFVGILGFSQLLFAWAAEDMRSRNWLQSHRKMYEFFQGVPHVTVPDCLKQGVSKCHLYDPDLNPAYAELASHYQTSVVPARPSHPKDKALAEGAVKIIMRYFKWIHRRRTFTSIVEINRALAEAIQRINLKPHTRFKVSRLERWEKVEKTALKALPVDAFDAVEWKQVKLHPDCYVTIDSAYYTAPHIHRGKILRAKISENQIELFLGLERLAIHSRDRHKCGNRIKNPEHLPPNSKAYYEATPQNLISQSRFICLELNVLVDELFQQDTLGNIRRVQGLIRTAIKEINETTRAIAIPRIQAAVEQMKRYQKFKVTYFQETLEYLRKLAPQKEKEQQEIIRFPNNPMLRYSGLASDLTNK
jgi:hypothetical protein